MNISRSGWKNNIKETNWRPSQTHQDTHQCKKSIQDKSQNSKKLGTKSSQAFRGSKSSPICEVGYRTTISRSCFLYLLLLTLVALGRAESRQNVDEKSTTVESTNLSVLPPTVTTLQAMSTTRQRPDNVVLSHLTTVDNKKVIPTVEQSTNKNEITVDESEDKVKSRPESEKEIIIYEDIYPRRVKLSQLRRYRQQQLHETHPQQLPEEQHTQQLTPPSAGETAARRYYQQRVRHERERRRRLFPGPPVRQQLPHLPPSLRPPLRHPVRQQQHFHHNVGNDHIDSVLRPPEIRGRPRQHSGFPPPPRVPHQLIPSQSHQEEVYAQNDYIDDYVDVDESTDDSNRRVDFNWWLGGQPPRKQQERGRSHSPTSAPNGSVFRNMLGVSPFCLHDDVQFNCVFTPVCWMAGGVTLSGCDSMLYSCCVEPSVARKDVATARAAELRVRSEIVSSNEPECGIAKHRQFSKRIIGGQKAKFAELPWQVHIRISSYQCGGVLLNHWYVATAAHCVHQAKLDQISVHLGEYDTKNAEGLEPIESESFDVESISLHPEFRYMLTQPDRFDIALLKLNNPVYYRDNIIPICLPTQDYPLTGEEGTVAGWGKTDNSFGKTGTNILNKVQVPIIDNRQCKRWHKDKAIAVQLHDEMFCAGYKEGKQDACLGDSGGPLVINIDGRWTLIGITSAGFGCAVEKQPGIYHKVSKSAPWIAKMISQP